MTEEITHSINVSIIVILVILMLFYILEIKSPSKDKILKKK